MTQRRRHVFHIPGYDPVSPQDFQARFIRQLGFFRRTWNVEADVSDAKAAAGFATWTVETSGPNWRAVTEFELLAWDDLIERDAARSQLTRTRSRCTQLCRPDRHGNDVPLCVGQSALFRFLDLALALSSAAVGPGTGFRSGFAILARATLTCGDCAGVSRRSCVVLLDAALARMATSSGARRLVFFSGVHLRHSSRHR